MLKIPDSNSKRIGIWIRVSTEDQVRGESPEHHERRARAYAEVKGWNVVEVYRLDAISGKTVKDTPEGKRMLADIRRGHVTGLVFSKLARLARNTKELLEFSEIFRECGADLISLAESIDTSTPAGRLFYTMIAAMAQWEREEIAERVAASIPVRAKLGKPLGGKAPFGYQWKDKKLVPDPAEAPVRRLLYELFREHKRKGTVARLLNERGYRTRSGAPFTHIAVGRLICDASAKGIRRAAHTQRKAGTRGAWTLKPESEWVLHEIEAIIPEELWDECNAILAERERRGKPPSKRTVHLFAGLVFCHCGEKMYVPSNIKNKYVCQACRNKIPVDDLERLYHGEIKDFLFSPDKVAAHLEQADEIIRGKSELLAHLEEEHRKAQASIDKLYDLYQSGAIDKQGFGAKYHPLAERLRQYDDELPAAQADLDVLKIAQLSQEEILSGARDLNAAWPTLPPEEKRVIVETITERISVSPDEVAIDLIATPDSWLPPPGGDSPSGPPTPSGNAGKMGTQPPHCGQAPAVPLRADRPRSRSGCP